MQLARDERCIMMLSNRVIILSDNFPRTFNKLGRFPPRDFTVTWEGISGRKSELCAEGHRTRQGQGPDQLVNAGPGQADGFFCDGESHRHRLVPLYITRAFPGSLVCREVI